MHFTPCSKVETPLLAQIVALWQELFLLLDQRRVFRYDRLPRTGRPVCEDEALEDLLREGGGSNHVHSFRVVSQV